MQVTESIIKRLESECTDIELQWINEKLDEGLRTISLGFVMAHRFISSDPISSGSLLIDDTPYHIDLTQWSRDQLARVALLLSLDNGKKDDFQEEIETLFKTADNRESEALYAAIPLFNYPEVWKHRATEAIRSNVGHIFDAMAFNNPYPALHFDETAWNQLVLKTIFSEKSIWRITGLEDRHNKELARAISDFAHERWTAGRILPAEVWYLTEPYPGDRFWEDTIELLTSSNPANQEAGYLLWKSQASQAPGNVGKTFGVLFSKLEQKNVEWKHLGKTIAPT